MKLVRNNISLTLLLAALVIQGCAQNKSLSPPANSEKIHFTATIPEELEALPISAMYRSKICGKERRTSNMKPYTVPGFQREKYPLTQLSSNQVMVDIPKDGGGRCDWKLSNINFEVKLKDINQVNESIKNNFSFKITVIIDDNTPQEFNGGYIKKVDKLYDTLTLFPLLRERFLGGGEKSFYLIGKSEILTYKIENNNEIHFNFLYKKDMLSYWQGRKTHDDDTSMTYPNGEIKFNAEVRPNFDKLMKIYESSKVK